MAVEISETRAKVIEDLDYVLTALREGRFMSAPTVEDAIGYLSNSITRLREDIYPEGEETDLLLAYETARLAEKSAEQKVEAYFWPLIRDAKTEAEARALYRRFPPNCAVLKACAMDYFVYQSGVIPKPERASA